MLDETDLLYALQRHWEYAGKDEDIAHEIYHDDAVLEFPQSGERFEGVENFREWRRQYPAALKFHTRALALRRTGRSAVPGALEVTCSAKTTAGSGRGDLSESTYCRATPSASSGRRTLPDVGS